MFCPRCGKSGEKLFDGLCKSCFIEKTILIHAPDEMEVTVCAHCGSTLSLGKWQLILEQETIDKAIKEHITIDDAAENVKIFVETISIRGTIFECLVHATGSVIGKDLEQNCKVDVKIENTVCPECNKFLSGYYEAVIQIRADHRLPLEEEIEAIDKLIMDNIKSIGEKNRMAYISLRSKLKEGVDYQVGSYQVAKRLSNTIKDSLGGIIKESPRHMGKDKTTGKNLYRIWISIRLPHFRKGDFIRYLNLTGQVVGMDGRGIIIKDLRSTNTKPILWREYPKVENIAKKQDLKKTIVASKTPTSIQILHPDTYQPIDIEINEENAAIRIGVEVSVVEIEGNFYILKSHF